MTDLAQAHVAYQQALEGRRSLTGQQFDHELLEQIDEDLDKHRMEVDLAWLAKQ